MQKKREHFKKVVSDKTVLMGTDLTQSRDTIMMTNHYQRRLRLACGHVLWRRHSARVPATAFCEKCAAVDA